MKTTTRKAAIVTGGTRGIGAAISLALAKQNILVAAVYKSSKDQADLFSSSLKAVSPDSLVIQGDVSRQQDIDRIVSTTEEAFGRIDILVNNAGMFEFKMIDEMDEAFVNEIMQVNFISQLMLTKACSVFMKKNKFGRIINASSISGKIADVGLIGYGCSKAAVNMMTAISAAELAPYGITVNAYAPGIIHTDLTDSMIRERGETQRKQIPLNRFGSCEEAASLITYLVSEEAGYITGEIIGIDGGMMKVQNPYRAHQNI